MKRERIDRAALMTGARSQVPSSGSPLVPAGPAQPQSAASLAMGLPAPRESSPDALELAEGERRDLAACEMAIDHLRVAFWAAGKALQVIRDGRLYRETHDTFEAYVSQRWDMSRAQAYRLIDAWPVAERLGVSPVGDMLTESHVRALLPVARTHGPDVAAEVYREIAATDGVRVTAALLADAAGSLRNDSERLAGGQAAQAVRSFLATRLDGAQEGRPPEAECLAVVQQALTLLRKASAMLADDTLAAAMEADTERGGDLLQGVAMVSRMIGKRASAHRSRQADAS